jgi:hypothetical protein
VQSRSSIVLPLLLCAAACGPAKVVTDGDDNSAATPAPSTWRSVLYSEDWQPGPAAADADGRVLHDFSWAGYRNGASTPQTPADVADAATFGADPTGTSDSTAALQAAIDSAVSGGGVLIPAGTYRIDGLLRIERDGVVLRGQGATQTRLHFTRGDGMTDTDHLQASGALSLGAEHALSVDGVVLADRVTVSDPAGLAVGDDVALGWVITDEFI